MNKPKTDSQLNTVGCVPENYDFTEMEKALEWTSIDWKKLERRVFKLQKRIYAASRRGDIKQVRRLQKTLMRSWSNKMLAVRRVTQDNRGKKTAGVDGVKSLSSLQRFELVGQLKITGKGKPVRRVWIPKPGKSEKRPLGIPTMYDRALQAVVKNALEPEWEATFEPNSYGFRPGRSCHDAISMIKKCIQHSAKYVLDADIKGCFDNIDHEALLNKLNQKGSVRRQVKSWLKAGVIDLKIGYNPTTQGTPQGGVISPLLANIALHGLENYLKQYAENSTGWRYKSGALINGKNKAKSLTIIRYADDFVILHQNKSVVEECRELVAKWLEKVGLEIKPEKTRLTHTLLPEESEDGKAGFDFLGFHIQQYKVGKHKSDRDTHGRLTGFDTLITPTKEALKVHQLSLKKTIDENKSPPQVKLIKELNSIIRGWTQYYSHSDAKTLGALRKMDNLLYLKLKRWGYKRCGSVSKAHKRYWHNIGNRNWVFSTRAEKGSYTLLKHDLFECSSNSYVKVKGDKSPYDGDSVYWSTRMGRHPEVTTRVATRIKRQKGKCTHCGHYFRDGDIMEVDHITPKKLGGKDDYSNLQLLHGHCHDVKTASDGSRSPMTG
jgi:RNA-directed DNA polymerase